MRGGLYMAVLGLVTAACGYSQRPEARLVYGEEQPAVLRPAGSGEEPWLGVSVRKPSTELYAHLVGVPTGVGFVVHSVAAGGPAALAGVRQYDFLWKIGDQMLVNEAQFLVLLHHHKVGDSVTLTVKRGAEDQQVEAVLMARPTSETGRAEAEVAVMSEPPMPGLPKQLMDTLRQVASIKGPDGVEVRLERRGANYHWQRLDREGRLLREGEVRSVEELGEVRGSDPGLAKKLRALVRAVEDAENRAKSGTQRSRVRQVADSKKGAKPR